uniref:SSD domain-containing protein n=1 Tax=Parastrongyloides trichosuri TaxID=131310 RepID=A0A0N4Z5X7_PARTI
MRNVNYLLRNGFHELLERIFSQTGISIGHSPYKYLIITLVLSLLSIGILNISFAQKLQDGFTSRYSRSHLEEKIFFEFHSTTPTQTERFVALIKDINGNNLMEKDMLSEVMRFHKFLQYSFNVSVNGVNYTYGDFCDGFCDINKGFYEIVNAIKYENSSFQKSGKYSGRYILSWPKSYKYGFEFNVAMHLFGAKLKSNFSSIKNDFNRIENVEMIALHFYANYPNDNITNIVTEWEQAVYDYLKSGQIKNDFPSLDVNVLGDKILGREIIRGGLSLLPYLVMGFILTLIFVFVCVMISTPVQRLKFSINKPLIVFGIVISPILAVTTTFGIVGFLQLPIYPIQFVIPFLILAIGVDDAFLILHSWNRLYPKIEKLSGKKKIEIIPNMIQEVLEEIGPSITITSLTNVIAFGVGSTMSTPAIQLFCMSAMLAMIIDFIYELTFFTSLLVIAEKLQISSCAGELSQVDPRDNQKYNANMESNIILLKKEDIYKNDNRIEKRIMKSYCHLLTSNIFRLLILIVMIIFIFFSILGTLKIEPVINSQQIIPSDSLLQRTDRLFEKYTWKEYELLTVILNNPPNISSVDGLEKLKTIVRKFETIPQALGNISTFIFLNDFETYLHTIRAMSMYLVDINFSIDYLPEFLEDLPHWKMGVKMRNKTILDKISFQTGYFNSSTWIDRANLMLKWREVADMFPENNVTIYCENSPIFEGIFNLKYNTLQTVIITLICMFIVCIFFVPSFAGVISAVVAITSISFGVFGFLYWWNLNLDPVSMSAIVMSIGFSVDYTAHVAYHYQKMCSVIFYYPSVSTYRDIVIIRLYHTLDAVAWPMLQAASSTMICFIPVLFTSDYTPTVFLRTITLVIGWGIFHGLAILPTLLAIFPESWYCIKQVSTQSGNTKGSIDIFKINKDEDTNLLKNTTNLKSIYSLNLIFDENFLSGDLKNVDTFSDTSSQDIDNMIEKRNNNNSSPLCNSQDDSGLGSDQQS